jgi:hypothetical protein
VHILIGAGPAVVDDSQAVGIVPADLR